MPQSKKSNQIKINVVGSSTFGRYPNISLEKTYNMYISDEWLINFPGYKKVLNIIDDEATTEGRGGFSSARQNIMVVVINSAVYVIDSVFTPTFVGNLATSFGAVFMDENLNNQICIVDGIYAYIYNHSIGSLTRQDVNDALLPNYVCYHNTFFLFGNANVTGNGSKWFAYSYSSPTTIAETSELALQTKPDYALAAIRLPGEGNNVMVLGRSVGEFFTQVGGLENYQRNASINVDYGVISVSTIAANDRYVFWLGSNKSNSAVIMAYTSKGTQAISTDGIDYILGNLTEPKDSTAFFFLEDGHLFYQITFYNPADNLTLVYDVDQKKFYHLSDYNLDHHPARSVMNFQNRTYFLSLDNGSLYNLSSNYTTYNENIGFSTDSPDREIPRIRICSNTRSPDSQTFRAGSLTVTITQGNDPDFSRANLIGTFDFIVDEEDGDVIITEQGTPIISQSSAVEIPYIPRVDLSISKDGAQTFGATVGIEMNPLGHRQNIMRWRRPIGLTNNFTAKFRFWGTSYWSVNNAYLDIY